MVKLNQNISRTHDPTIPIIMKKVNEGERRVPSSSCTHTGYFLDFLQNFWKYPEDFRNCPFFKPEDISALG
jgi:hypothetical protein